MINTTEQAIEAILDLLRVTPLIENDDDFAMYLSLLNKLTDELSVQQYNEIKNHIDLIDDEIIRYNNEIG